MSQHVMPSDITGLLDLALTGGALDEVALVFEGLDAEFRAPIGWMLHLTRIEPSWAFHCGIDPADGDEAATRNHLMVSARIGEGATAFMGIDPQNQCGIYLDVAEIAEWITAPRNPAAGKPVASTAAHTAQVITAARLGWAVTQTIGRSPTVGDLVLPPRIAYRFEASNWFYNDPTSPYHRDRGTAVSVSMALGRGAERTPGVWDYALRGAERITADEIAEAVAARPPWYAQVARFDDELETWVR